MILWQQQKESNAQNQVPAAYHVDVDHGDVRELAGESHVHGGDVAHVRPRDNHLGSALGVA